MAGDSNYNYVSLLLHCDGTNGSTTFTDNSPSPKTVTANGNAQISTAQSVYGGASGLFDGTGDYLTLSSSSAFALGTADFTIEFRIRLNADADSGGKNILDFRASAGASPFTPYVVNSGSGNFIGVYTSFGGGSVVWDGALSTDTWYAVAVQRTSGSWACYINGTARSFTTGNATSADGDLGSSSNQLYIASNVSGSGGINAYLDEIRITKGVARYSSNYTPATEAFPNTLGASIVGNGQISLTPSATLSKYHHASIVGSSSISVVPSATLSKYPMHYAADGNAQISLTPAASWMHQSVHHSIEGSADISITPSASWLHKNIDYSIVGDSAISITSAATMNKYPQHYSINGASSIAVTGNAVMRLALHYHASSSLTINLTPSADKGLNRNRIYCEMPFTFEANGYQEIPNTLTVAMSLPTFEALGGGELSVEMLPAFAAFGYAEVNAALSAEMPMEFAFSGYTSSDGELAVAMGFSFAAEGGGELAVAMPLFTFEASSVVGTVGEMTVIMPRFEFAADGDTRTSIGTLNVEMPFLVANYGALYVEMAMDFKAWTAPAQASLVTYAMNVKTAETTTYTNFDFKYIMRLGYNYYGVKDDGLYLLGGETDNGTAINASLRTAQSMYGTNLRKRSPKIYLDTENTTSILPIVDTEEGEYVYESEFGGRKVSLGRGYEGKIWEFELANVDGEAWRVGAMEIQLDVLSRRI